MNWHDSLRIYQQGHIALLSAALMNRWKNEAWVPSDDDRKAAAKLHTQIVSRITTQQLGYLDGIETAALASVYSLFEKTRQIVDEFPGSRYIDALAWDVLNTHVRPFTAKWHRESQRGALDALDSTDEFRAQLAGVQLVLQRFDDLLLQLRDGQQPTRLSETSVKLQPDGAVEMDHDVIWGIARSLGGKGLQNATAIDAAERTAVNARRKHYELPVSKPHAVALALSGGGIRSATFSLGVLVALAKRGLLPQFDYLSTVSGGGYVGSFLTTFLQSPTKEVGLGPSQLPFRREEGEAKALRHIRHHSKHLAAGSLWQRFKMVCAQLYGMTLNGVAVLLLLALLAAVERSIRILDRGDTVSRRLTDAAPMLLMAGALCALAIVRFRTKWQRWSGALVAVPGIMLLTLLCWTALGIVHAGLDDLSSCAWSHGAISTRTCLALLGCTLAIASALISISNRHNRFRLLLVIASALATPLFLFGAYLLIYQWTETELPSREWALSFVAGLLYFFLLDINFTSPHRPYRDKLAQAYLIAVTASSDGSGSFVSAVRTRLSDIGKDTQRGPYHLLNCALNVPASKNTAMQGRFTDFFVFSPAFTGSPLTGYFETQAWENVDPHLDLGTAMAISAAAASPQMGLGTMKQLSFWLALLNIRLGYWARRPDATRNRLPGPPGISCLFREMTGVVDEDGPWLNLSDGGHIENLGVYELLRRRCKYIVAVDGEEDPKMTFQGLATLQRLAAIDLGVRIDIDLDDLRLNDRGLSRSHFRFCRIHYPSAGRGSMEEFGYLLYLKLSLTGNEGEFIRRYRLDQPVFPHHSTADQLFSEAQFEAYRSLGEHVGDKLFLRAIIGDLADADSIAVEHWFRALGRNLLEPLPVRAGRPVA